ncbi:MAG TPA: hypothetical protein VMM78_05605, partial [Thermomicrobiales bacterium]|nr:hypothetical protein [Thermomicrobiales bacterium]
MRYAARLVLVIVVLSLVAACGGNDDDANGSSPSPAATTASGTGAEDESDDAEATEDDSDSSSTEATRAPLAVGSSVEVRSEDPDPATAGTDNEGTVRVTIIGILDDPEVTNILIPPTEGEKFWALEVTMEATSDEVVNTGLWSMRLADGQNLASTYALQTFGPELTYGAIEAGETREG